MGLLFDRRWRGASACALVIALLALAVGAPAGNAQSTAVSIVDRAYQPNALTVGLGQMVTWTNDSLGPHTVTSVDGVFDSGRIEPTQTFSLTFTKAGTFNYSCTIHPTMKGSVLVLAQAPETVLLHMSLRSTARGKRTLVAIQAARSDAGVLLQVARPGATSWQTTARGRLDSTGRATLTLAGASARRVRVVVLAAAGAPRMVSPVVRSPA